MNKKIFKHARKLHKWLGYLLALQILAWLLGGLIMSAIPLDKVHGEHLATRTLNNPFTQADYVASLDDIASQVVNPTQIIGRSNLTTPLTQHCTCQKITAKLLPFAARYGEYSTFFGCYILWITMSERILIIHCLLAFQQPVYFFV